MASKIAAPKTADASGLILGIDPGLDRTGYAVLDCGDGTRICEAGLIRTTVKTPLPRRLSEIDESLTEILNEHSVTLVAVEDLYSHYAHPRTAILMGHARGVVLCVAARKGIEVISYAATKIKRTLTGNGHAGKAQVQRAIMVTLGLSQPPDPPDVADALAVAWTASILRRVAGR